MRGHRYIIQNFINGEGEVFLGYYLTHPSGNDFSLKLHDLSDNSAQRSNPNIKNSWKNNGLSVLDQILGRENRKHVLHILKSVIQRAHALLAKYVAEMGEESERSSGPGEICCNQKGFSEIVL